MFTVAVCLWSAVPLLAPAAQSPRFAAVFDGGGSITWSELYIELARRHRGRPLGKQALEHLVERRIVILEAAERQETVSAEEVHARVATIRRQLASRHLTLEKHLDSRGISLAEFRDEVRLSLLYDRFAHADLGLAASAALPADARKLWLREKERLHHAVDDVKELPAGVAAIVGGHEIDLEDLGKTMARNLVAGERRALLRQMVAYRLLVREAAARDIEVTAEDRAAALAAKRRRFESDPRYEKLGITLESMLFAQGRSLADLEQGEVFRAEVLIAALGTRLYPDEALRAAWDADRRLWQGRIGTSRETHRLLVQGPPRRPLAQAKVLCARIKSRIRGPQSFAPAARRFSEDESSKGRGGNLGFLHRHEQGVDEALLAAAFALEVGAVSDPVRDRDGYSLLLVTRTRQGPTGDARWAALRQWEVAAWLRGLVTEAHIRFFPLPK